MTRALLLLSLALAVAGCEGQFRLESEDMGDGVTRYRAYYSMPLHNATGFAVVVQDSVSACLLRAGETREWTPGGGPVEISAPEGYDAPAESTVTHTGPLPSPELTEAEILDRWIPKGRLVVNGREFLDCYIIEERTYSGHGWRGSGVPSGTYQAMRGGECILRFSGPFTWEPNKPSPGSKP